MCVEGGGGGGGGGMAETKSILIGGLRVQLLGSLSGYSLEVHSMAGTESKHSMTGGKYGN